MHSLGSLINHAVAATTPAQAMRAQRHPNSAAVLPGQATDAIMLERRRRGICLLIEHMNEHARDRAERRVCRQRLRQQRADRLAVAAALCERWAEAVPDAPAAVAVLTEALAIASSQHEVRENVLLRSGCFPHIRRSLEGGAEAQQQLALALVRALCTSRHNRRELRRAGVIPCLVMLLLPTVAVQQQAGAAAAILALVQGERSGSGRSTAAGCNVPNLKLLADHADAMPLLEAVVAAGKQGSNILGAHLQGGLSDVAVAAAAVSGGGGGGDAMEEGDHNCASAAATEAEDAAGGASSAASSSHAGGGAAAACNSEAVASDAAADSTLSSAAPAPAPAPAPARAKRELVGDSAAASSAAAAFAAADASAIISLLRHTLPQAIAARAGAKGGAGGVVHSDPDALPPPPPGESSGASHTSR